MRTLLTPRVRRLAPVAALAGATMGFVIFIATSDGVHARNDGRVGGDFPEFYASGELVRSGKARLLYDSRAQQEAQSDFLPGTHDAWIPFPYPPYVGIIYAPFSLLSFKAAYVAHTLLMAACCVLALHLLASGVPRLRHNFLPCVAAALTFYPLFRSIVGGQNTALSLLCGAGTAVMLTRRKDFAAGLCLGAWMFKPQFGAVAFGLIALGGWRRQMFSGMALVCSGWYLAGAVLGGAMWPLWWWHDGIAPFARVDLMLDRWNGVSFPHIAAFWGLPALGWIVTLITVCAVVPALWRLRDRPLRQVGLASVTAVLVSPHALFYDGGLAVLSLVGGEENPTSSWPSVLCAVWVVAAAQAIRRYLPFPPVSVILLASLLLGLRRLNRVGRDFVLLKPDGKNPASVYLKASM